MSPYDDVAAIVVTYRTGPRLTECLHALHAQTGITELVIVDNGNPPDMVDWISDFVAARTATPNMPGQEIRYIKPDKNIGFGSAVNLGAKDCLANQLLIINPDCVVRPDALPIMLEASRGLSSPWMVGGRIFDVKGKAQRGPRRRELTLLRALSKVLGGAGINMPLEPQPNGYVRVDVTSGAFFLMDRAGFEMLGGVDEDYFLHVEDIDLCKRVQMVGGEIFYQPHAGALHYGATSDAPKLVVERHKADGFALYFRKFAKGPIHRMFAELFIPLIRFGLMMRARFGGR